LIGQHKIDAAPRQRLADAKADTVGGGGDENDLAGEIHQALLPRLPPRRAGERVKNLAASARREPRHRRGDEVKAPRLDRRDHQASDIGGIEAALQRLA
jgi:hypothetical protein